MFCAWAPLPFAAIGMDADCGIVHIWTVFRLTLCLWHLSSSALLNLILGVAV